MRLPQRALRCQRRQIEFHAPERVATQEPILSIRVHIAATPAERPTSALTAADGSGHGLRDGVVLAGSKLVCVAHVEGYEHGGVGGERKAHPGAVAEPPLRLCRRRHR